MTLPLVDADPRQVDDITIESRIGEGASAVVYLGRLPEGDRVAVKMLHRELAASRAVRDLLNREAAALGRVRGRRVARVIRVDADAVHPYIVTEYVPGESLAYIVERSPLPGALLTSVLAGVAEALEDIHAAGIIHRDLKPSNIIFGPDGVRVVDFGISALDEFSGSTRTGVMLGTPAWLSPEQAVGRLVTPASDVFNFGLLIVFLATGRNPFGQGRPDAMLYRVVNEPPDLSDLTDDLRSLAQQCLAKDPATRPQPAEVRRELEQHYRSDDAEPAAPRSAGTDATVLGSSTMIAGLAAGDHHRMSVNASLPRRRRGLIVGLSIALGLVATTLAIFIANLVAPFGGSIEVRIDNQSRDNQFLSEPVVRVDVDNGESGKASVTDADSSVSVGTWHPDSRITISYEPGYAEDEAYSRTFTAEELGYGLLRVGQSMEIGVTVTDDTVRVLIPGDQRSAASLERADEGAYIDAQTSAYQGCVADVPASWSTELAAFLGATTAYNKSVEEKWGNAEYRDFTDWAARARDIADDLFVARSDILASTPGLDSVRYEYSSDVSSARDAVWNAMMDLGSYWDDYSTSLYNAYNYPDGQLNDLFPRENSMIELGQDALWDAVADLNSAISSDSSSYCRAQYPDAR